ncbi:hypothetical protein [Croceicoccus marinus]|uniref:Uncharacterized protein n=1 Tax=Croceicoccus marinus TaxID=450378 RepID=A0A7G6VSG4_9SPHN|nr:hypothetical protein [Croceicoccus marinus]QNE04679.1 hypothetical protein H4O24_12040 [Croceicoccus marinus]
MAFDRLQAAGIDQIGQSLNGIGIMLAKALRTSQVAHEALDAAHPVREILEPQNCTPNVAGRVILYSVHFASPV